MIIAIDPHTFTHIRRGRGGTRIGKLIPLDVAMSRAGGVSLLIYHGPASAGVHHVVGDIPIRRVASDINAAVAGRRGWPSDMEANDLRVRVDDKAIDVHSVAAIHRERLVVANGASRDCDDFVVRARKNDASIACHSSNGARLDSCKIAEAPGLDGESGGLCPKA